MYVLCIWSTNMPLEYDGLNRSISNRAIVSFPASSSPSVNISRWRFYRNRFVILSAMTGKGHKGCSPPANTYPAALSSANLMDEADKGNLPLSKPPRTLQSALPPPVAGFLFWRPVCIAPALAGNISRTSRRFSPAMFAFLPPFASRPSEYLTVL